MKTTMSEDKNIDNTEANKNYWEKAMTFDQYMKVAEERTISNPNLNDEYQEYYELGFHRMIRAIKTFKLDPEQVHELEAKNFKGKILMITEPWCGDASATVPAVSKFFEVACNEVKVFLRDTDTSLIDQYLTNGTQSIPKVIIFNDDFTVKADWGPRPKHGLDLLKKFKENPDTYSKDDFHNDLQVYYAKNRGKDTIQEIIALL